jgi:NAD(P)-dependent dehydrogenase (short-subunit alcohol dehydrogenase family)
VKCLPSPRDLRRASEGARRLLFQGQWVFAMASCTKPTKAQTFAAGICHDLDETIDEVTTEEFIRVMVTHTLSPMRVTQALAGAAQRQDWLDVVPRPVFDRPLELAYIIPD